MDVTQQPVFSGTTVSLQLNLTLVTEEGEEKQTCSSRALLSFSSLPAVMLLSFVNQQYAEGHFM